MPEAIKRKCNYCENQIKIYKDDIKDVVYYKKLYYHKSCFCELAREKSQSKRGKPADWQYALDNIIEFENAAIEQLEYPLIKADFNEYLITTYNVVAVPDRLWTVVGELAQGKYKKKKCKPVSLKILFEAWQWGQRNLNKIASKNSMNHNGPTNDDERILYDLAILVRKLPLYFKKQAQAVESETRIKEAKESAVRTSVFNYEKLSRQAVSSTQEESNDILDLMNEIF